MATTSTGQAGGLYLPTQKTIGNKEVMPVKQPQQLDPTKGNVQQPGFGMDYKTTSTTGGGLLGIAPTSAGQKVSTTDVKTTSQPAGQNINVTKPVKPESPEFNYESNGYTGVQGSTDKQYDPRSESLVQNQLTGLLDPNSALMKRAVSQTQEAAAGRGLQSSSIAAGAGMGAMIDRALPIAQQDAQTYGNAQQLGWQQNFTSEQNNLNREHDANMFDKNATFQAQMQDLQYRQQLGTLDYQGQQQLQQMERSAQLQQQRDHLMQQFDFNKMDKAFVQDLEKTKLQFDYNTEMFEKQVGAQAALDYRNASTSAYNSYLEQVASVYSNPNMTPEQQAAGVAKLQQLFQQQQSALQAIYGFAAPAQPGNNNAGVTVPPNETINNPANPNTGPIQYPVNPPNPNPNPGGGGGRYKDQQYQQVER